MDNLGAYLKAQREKRGIRLEEIASITKIHLHSLELLEANHWAQLPPEPFIRGFITAYAKYVGLDPKDVLVRYQEEMQTLGVQPAPQMPTPPTAESAQPKSPDAVIQDARVSPFTKVLAATACLVVVLVVSGVIYLGKQRATDSQVGDTETAPQTTQEEAPPEKTATAAPVDPPVEEPRKPASPPAPTAPAPTSEARPTSEQKAPAERKEIAPLPASAPVGAATVPAAKPTPAPAANVADASASHQVVVEAKQRTWLKVLTDGNRPVEEFLGPGESKTFTANSKIRVILGNSTGTVVTHNGQVSEGTKYAGTIRMYTFPTNAHFPRELSHREGASQEATAKSSPTLDDESTQAPVDDAEPVPHEGSESLSPAAQD